MSAHNLESQVTNVITFIALSSSSFVPCVDGLACIKAPSLKDNVLVGDSRFAVVTASEPFTTSKGKVVDPTAKTLSRVEWGSWIPCIKLTKAGNLPKRLVFPTDEALTALRTSRNAEATVARDARRAAAKAELAATPTPKAKAPKAKAGARKTKAADAEASIGLTPAQIAAATLAVLEALIAA